ncbi:hypothetical protein V8Z74_24540 [Comamonas sp. w2-DMI]|uniref:hypothetical protein n=1 Tax=Comamonas sp. w2-DMI TaxID=3126391 RepID=UPI0032E3AF73
MTNSVLSRIFHPPGAVPIAFEKRENTYRSIKIGHPLIEDLEAQGRITNLLECARKGELYALHVLAGRIPCLVLHDETSHAGFVLQPMYPEHFSHGHYTVAEGQLLTALGPDSAIYWHQASIPKA